MVDYRATFPMYNTDSFLIQAKLQAALGRQADRALKMYHCPPLRTFVNVRCGSGGKPQCLHALIRPTR